jgi:tRNA A-37 threonylcarbamoyl transferase component Bud32
MADYRYINMEYAQPLKDQGLLDFDRLIRWSDGRVVSRHDGRRCLEMSVQATPAELGTLFLRQEHRIPWGEVLADLVRFRRPTSRAVKMLAANELFMQHDIEVAPLHAVIERRYLGRPRRSVAIQAKAPGQDIFTQLLHWGRPGTRVRNPLDRQRLLYELGGLLAKIHSAKIVWPDLVAKHFFVQRTDSDGIQNPAWRFTLIDVERAETGLTTTIRDRQLDRFFYSLRSVLSPTDLLRIAVGYIGLNKKHPRPVRRTLWEKYFPQARKWIGHLKEETCAVSMMPPNQPMPEEECYERIGNLVVNVRYKEILEKQGLLDPKTIFTFQKGSELYKPGLGRRFRMRFDAFMNNHWIWLYLKRVHHPRIQDQLDRIFSGTVRHSGCWHERSMIKQMGLCRIPAPVVVAYAEKMAFCYELASTLITQGLVGQSLEVFVPKHFVRGADHEEILRRRAWTRQLAQMIGRFHRNGFCHRDLYLAHIFIGFKRNGNPIFYLIDLARCFKVRWRKQRWLIKDLSALNFSAPNRIISRTDRMRFFLTYLEKSKLDQNDKTMVRAIVAKCERISRHNQKHRKTTQERAVQS